MRQQRVAVTGAAKTFDVACRRAARWRIGRIPVLIVLGLVLTTSGCRTFNVQTDWDGSVEFDNFERFYFLEPPQVEGADPFADNSLLRKRVRLAVEKVLDERGYRPAGSAEEADFVVTFAVLLEREIRADGVAAVGGGGYYRRGGGFISASSSVRAYQESTLLLDLLEPTTDDLMWRGWGVGIVGTRDRDRGAKRIEKGVRAILKKFPPEGG